MTILRPAKRITKSKWVVMIDNDNLEEALKICREQFGEPCRNPSRGKWRVGWTEVADARSKESWASIKKGVRFFFYDQKDVDMFTVLYSLKFA